MPQRTNNATQDGSGGRWPEPRGSVGPRGRGEVAGETEKLAGDDWLILRTGLRGE